MQFRFQLPGQFLLPRCFLFFALLVAQIASDKSAERSPDEEKYQCARNMPWIGIVQVLELYD